jgi:hypothetical protein
MVLFVISFMIIFLYHKKINLNFVFYFVFFILCLLIAFPEEYILFPLVRAFSGVLDVGERFSGTMSNFTSILDAYFFHGEGIGFFTLGAKNFGGDVIYLFSSKFSSTENGWLRIVGETGVIGAFVYGAIFSLITTRSLIVFFKSKDFIKWIPFVCFVSSFGFIIWSNTHDLFGNYTTMCLLFIFVGATESLARSKYVILPN